MDPKMIGEVGGDLLFTNLTRPHKAVMLSFGPSLFQDIDKGALIVCDNVLLEKLQYTVTRAVEDRTFHRCCVLLIIDEETLNSAILLKKLPVLFKNPAVKLLCMQRSGRTVHNGPKAPVEPNMSLMTNTEECTFVRAVSEAPTAQEAIKLWNPKVKTTPAKKLKRLNTQSPKAPKEQTSSRGGSRGGSKGRGRKHGRGGGHSGRRGGPRGGGRSGYRDGYRSGRSTSSRGPMIVQKGIHYHIWQ